MSDTKLTREQLSDLDDWMRMAPKTKSGEIFALIRVRAEPDGVSLEMAMPPRCDRCRWWKRKSCGRVAEVVTARVKMQTPVGTRIGSRLMTSADHACALFEAKP